MRHAKYKAPRPDELVLETSHEKMMELLYRWAEGSPETRLMYTIDHELADSVRAYRKAMRASVEKDLELEGFPPFEAEAPGTMETRVSMNVTGDPTTIAETFKSNLLDGLPPEFKAPNFAPPPRPSEPPPAP